MSSRLVFLKHLEQQFCMSRLWTEENKIRPSDDSCLNKSFLKTLLRVGM